MESKSPDRTVPRQAQERTNPQADPRQAADPPTPTQDEADALKQQAHGETEPEAPTAPPAVVDVPAVTGAGTVGQTLSCTMGNWTGEPTGYVYAWSGLGTANGDTYVVGAADAGTSITCTVTATNDLGSTQAPPSNAVAIT
jgi:hypothetical protein